MSDEKQEVKIVEGKSLPDGLLRFSHEAMATVFEIVVANDDANYASRAAHAAFDELDMIEEHLSRFLETSDVSMINSLPPGKPLVLGPDAYRCIRIALEIASQTNGAFDITISRLIDVWLGTEKKTDRCSQEKNHQAPLRTSWEMLQLNDSERTITVKSEGLKIDLGGIGKGYAVDRMGGVLTDWGVVRALLHGGASSALALQGPNGNDGWPVTLSDPRSGKEIISKIEISHRAISGSGLQKGEHIIDPNTGKPVAGKLAAWSFASAAARADGLSTAFMVMDIAEIEQFCKDHSDTGAIIILDKSGADGVKRFGI